MAAVHGRIFSPPPPRGFAQCINLPGATLNSSVSLRGNVDPHGSFRTGPDRQSKLSLPLLCVRGFNTRRTGLISKLRFEGWVVNG